MTKVLWFSRHEMSEEQKASLTNKLGEIEVNQMSRTINSAYDIKEEILAADVVAIVAPINIQAQVLKIAGDRPVIAAVSERKLVKKEDGEDETIFIFKEWQRLVKIDIVTETFCS